MQRRCSNAGWLHTGYRMVAVSAKIEIYGEGCCLGTDGVLPFLPFARCRAARTGAGSVGGSRTRRLST